MNARLNIPALLRGLKKLRKRNGMSQQQLAVRLGVALPTVSRWENNKAKPSPLALEKIEALLREMGSDGEDLIDKYIPNRAQIGD